MRQTSIVPRVAVIGLGNVLLGDDGFGPLTVEVFRSQYECGPEIEVTDLGTPGLDLTPYLYGRDLVIIVDAVNAEGKPGTVRTYSENYLSEYRAQLRLTDHDPGLQESLTQLRLIGHGPSELFVVGIIPERCGFGEAISSTVHEASSGASETIGQLLVDRGFDCCKRPDPVQPKLWWMCESLV